jgi:hypothetical protein
MPIPRTRDELTGEMAAAFDKLQDTLDAGGADLGDAPCVDGWTVRDVLAVRVWWTEHVVEWIEAGRRGETPIVPAPGYGWSETPRLNAEIVRESASVSLGMLRKRLTRAFTRTMATIDSLSDRELLEVGAFEWAGKWPISRWLSINTTRQYVTARTYVRRALRGRSKG